MKRDQEFSSSDSELDDSTEVEKESTEETENNAVSKDRSPSISQARRRRRGIVEKRRRDRINSSLSELRRLVPSAVEKQGSAKLEKAEILQMTVEHLKLLHATGRKGFVEAQTLAMDYRNMGFRECLAEAARYLSLMEGLQASDPLQVRLLSHLSSFASQREGQSPLRSPPWGTGVRTLLPAPSSPQPLHLSTLRPAQPTGTPGAAALCRATGPQSANAPLLSVPSSSTTPACSKSGLKLPLSSGRSAIHIPISHATAKLSAPLLTSFQPLSSLPLSLEVFPLLSPSVYPTPAASTAEERGPHRPWTMEVGAF